MLAASEFKVVCVLLDCMFEENKTISSFSEAQRDSNRKWSLIYIYRIYVIQKYKIQQQWEASAITSFQSSTKKLHHAEQRLQCHVSERDMMRCQKICLTMQDDPSKASENKTTMSSAWNDTPEDIWSNSTMPRNKNHTISIQSFS